MSRRSKRQNKGRKQKAAAKVQPVTVQPPPSQVVPSESGKRVPVLTLLGLFIGLVGLVSLIELVPRPSVSPASQVDPKDLFASRFTVTNDGYLQLNDVHAVCFIWKMQAAMLVEDNASTVFQPDNSILQPTQGLTVSCRDRLIPIQGPYRSADIAIVVCYRPWPFTLVRRRKFFRFVARFDHGNVFWEKQPSNVLEPDFDQLLVFYPTTQSLSCFK